MNRIPSALASLLRKLAVGTGLLLGLSGLSKGPVSYYALLLPFAISLLATGGRVGIRSHARDLGLALGIGVVVSSVWSRVAWMAMPHDFSRMLVTEQGAWLPPLANWQLLTEVAHEEK